VDLLDPLDLDRTAIFESGGLPVRLGLGLQSPARNSGEGGSGSTDGEALVVFRGGEVEDGVLRDVGNPRVTSAPSIASRRRSRGRLETCGAQVCFGIATPHSIVVKQNKPRA
jgi:hypothetical protein